MHWSYFLMIGIPLFLLVIYYGLPKFLNTLGLHPHYKIPHYNLTGQKALVITTSHDTLGETGKKTGVFASEMTVPYYAFWDAGMKVDIASIKGGKVPVEPHSMGWPLATADDYRFKRDAIAMEKLKTSLCINDIDIADYDVVFLAGGWGAAYDFAQSDKLGELISNAHSKGVLIGSVCHGALGLVKATDSAGKPIVENRKITGVTDQQISQLGIEITPKHPESELRKLGANFEANTAFKDMFATHVAVDGIIFTGQNQNSGYETSHRILERLSSKR
ncbi:type 1 glutamine amidotransferase domain-containing protein [Glaciecola petra]|uniref:Type 1 glutamine amidotransferase domain-containing protein n=1 Tax=Glaciecola petra TaxID=3075602 RepID=A0ABU2ZUY7_9ALTE|nr:type 1 glutamine amidotransferase domain-containing protein [Aestuariibacter sp. P117]MDT0596463.1 type 1 glutamine amidotransferase domain-containing protein [Aestuariibacter sp. P117]